MSLVAAIEQRGVCGSMCVVCGVCRVDVLVVQGRCVGCVEMMCGVWGWCGGVCRVDVWCVCVCSEVVWSTGRVVVWGWCLGLLIGWCVESMSEVYEGGV